MTHEQQQPRYARAPELRGQGPADGNRVNNRLAAARGHVQGSRQELPKMFAARGVGGPFLASAVLRGCPVWVGLSRGALVSRFVSLSWGRA
jgi:hypothetical protein